MISPDTARERLPENMRTRWRTDPDTGCWEWTGRLWVNGYGRLWHNRTWARAHRVAWETLIGPIPPGLILDHICHNPACINPNHLRPARHAENARYAKTRTDNTSGTPGVHYCNTKHRWIVQIRHDNGRTRRSFHTLEEATAWAVAERRKLHGPFAHERISQ